MEATTVEIDSIDIKYCSFRLPDKKRAEFLLASIAEHGILEPLLGVTENETFILLDGFKRIHCAIKLNIRIIPVESLAQDCAAGILNFLKISNAKSLHILEQAKLVEELRAVHKMSIPEIAKKLERSSAWVSVRLSFLKETTPYVEEQVFQDRFPARCAIYTLRQFTRVNGIGRTEADTFVRSVSGKGLSARDIDLLANAYFKGGSAMKEQIQKGDIFFALNKMKAIETSSDKLCDGEQRVVNDLEILQKYINRVNFKLAATKSGTNQFIAIAGLLVEGILGKLELFKKVLINFSGGVCHDRSGDKAVDIESSCKRH